MSHSTHLQYRPHSCIHSDRLPQSLRFYMQIFHRTKSDPPENARRSETVRVNFSGRNRICDAVPATIIVSCKIATTRITDRFPRYPGQVNISRLLKVIAMAVSNTSGIRINCSALPEFRNSAKAVKSSCEAISHGSPCVPVPPPNDGVSSANAVIGTSAITRHSASKRLKISSSFSFLQNNSIRYSSPTADTPEKTEGLTGKIDLPVVVRTSISNHHPSGNAKPKSRHNAPCLRQSIRYKLYDIRLDTLKNGAILLPSRAEPSRAEPSRQ